MRLKGRSYRFSYKNGPFETFSFPEIDIMFNEDSPDLDKILYQFKQFLVMCGFEEDVVEQIVIRRG